MLLGGVGEVMGLDEAPMADGLSPPRKGKFSLTANPLVITRVNTDAHPASFQDSEYHKFLSLMIVPDAVRMSFFDDIRQESPLFINV